MPTSSALKHACHCNLNCYYIVIVLPFNSIECLASGQHYSPFRRHTWALPPEPPPVDRLSAWLRLMMPCTSLQKTTSKINAIKELFFCYAIAYI